MLKDDNTFLNAVARNAFKGQIYLTKEGLIKIVVKENCVSKTELMKLLFLIRRNLEGFEIKQIRYKLVVLVADSINRQKKNYEERKEKVVK